VKIRTRKSGAPSKWSKDQGGRGDYELFYAGTLQSSQPNPELLTWVDDALGGPPT
jgi:hypothetical protein